MPLAHDVFSYLVDILYLSHTSSYDEGTFQVYQILGRSLAARASMNGTRGSLTVRLASELSLKLDAFNKSWQLGSGLGMELLWTTFRPVSARSLHQLESSNQTKDLANRFDALRWGSSISLQDLCRLQSSMARIHDAIRSISSLDMKAFEVWKRSLY